MIDLNLIAFVKIAPRAANKSMNVYIVFVKFLENLCQRGAL